ncbi:MAG: MFS transporter [Bacteroidota bacterium]
MSENIINQRKPAGLVLFLLVLSQFLATSLWFAGNAVFHELKEVISTKNDLTAALTISVQSGFILGTLIYAVFTIPDRYSPSKVFFVSAILAALSNVLITISTDFYSLVTLRFLTGFFIAGIYPVGMKIASDWFKGRLGNALGFLVGALVLGTSFPHLVHSTTMGVSWKIVLISTSCLAIIGGLIVNYLIGDGPNRKPMKQFSLKALNGLFRKKRFRQASYGYFGHMWELYAFWAFVPAMLTIFSEEHMMGLNISQWTFVIIASGSLGCIVGGLISRKYDSCKLAFVSLFISGICSLSFYFLIPVSAELFISFLVVWGFFVIMDSPQFSSVIADSAPLEYIGSALTIVNCIGFAITIVSIQLVEYFEYLGSARYYVLFFGPLFGLFPTWKVAGFGNS